MAGKRAAKSDPSRHTKPAPARAKSRRIGPAKSERPTLNVRRGKRNAGPHRLRISQLPQEGEKPREDTVESLGRVGDRRLKR